MLPLAEVWAGITSQKVPWEASWGFSGAVVDSRLVVAGSLFFALPGERHDGHEFVRDALERGAHGAVVARLDPGWNYPALRWNEPAPAIPPGPPVCFVVPDVLWALQSLGKHWRARFPACRVIGITGSVGKTTTKELIAAVLRQRYRTVKSEGNYNNEIGLPLTCLQLGMETERAVLEMGMYALGEITLLADIGRPQVGVVTNVGPTHLERLGSIERIARAKEELVQSLPSDGVAVLNGDDPRVRAMGARAPTSRTFYYGLRPENTLWASDIESYGLEGIALRFHYQGDEVFAKLPLLGRHSVYGALAAAAVGLIEDMTWEEIIHGLSDRSARIRLLVTPGVNGSIILDDTYNASPESTMAALNLLAEMPGRKVAVLGDMLELGDFEVEGHRLVGRRAAEVAEILVTVGQRGRLIGEEALTYGMPAHRVHILADNQSAAALLADILQADDFVLVKGSRGMAMEQIIAAIARGD